MHKINKYDLLYFCFFLIISLISYRIIEMESTFSIYGILSIILGFVGIGIWILKIRKINVPILIFLILSYICWFGEVIIKTLNLKYSGTLMIDQMEEYTLNKTLFYSILGYGGLFLGAIVTTQKEKVKECYDSIKDDNLRKAIIIVAIIMIIIGMPQFIINLIDKVETSMTKSYMAIYEYTASSPIENIINNLGMFFVPGIILLMVTCKKNQFVLNIAGFTVFINLVLSFIAGARGQAIGLAITFFWIYSTQIKKVTAKQMLIVIVICIIIIKSFSIISIFRVEREKNLSTLTEAIAESEETSAVVSSLKEMGANIFSLYHTINLIPEHKDYAYGYSYFASIMAIIPSALMGGHSFSNGANLAGWLMETLDLSYGPGYTILAESYYNFGFLGVLAMIVIGIIYSKILQNNVIGDKKVLYGAVVGIVLYICILTFRGTTLLIFRNYFYTILIPLIAINILKNTFKKNMLRREK